MPKRKKKRKLNKNLMSSIPFSFYPRVDSERYKNNPSMKTDTSMQRTMCTWYNLETGKFPIMVCKVAFGISNSC